MSQLLTVTEVSQTADSTTLVCWTDLRNLRQLLKNSGFRWEGLTNAERWRYHAYDYAFLRVRHGIFNQTYPLDPDGKWFNEGLVQAAERIYEPPRKPLYSGKPIRPADTERDPVRATHFLRQDTKRDALRRQVQVHGERLANGDPTPEMLAFMSLCVRQQGDNVKMFAQQGRKPFAPEARMTQAQVNAAMGVAATERRPKYEDPEELRRGRVALGIEP